MVVIGSRTVSADEYATRLRPFLPAAMQSHIPRIDSAIRINRTTASNSERKGGDPGVTGEQGVSEEMARRAPVGQTPDAA